MTQQFADFVTLAVTQSVTNVVGSGQASQRQIAILDASPAILGVLAGASANRIVNVVFGGGIVLRAGDTRAIWAVHQTSTTRADFDDLYSVLARRPGAGLTVAL